jgi:hypothetical protein
LSRILRDSLYFLRIGKSTAVMLPLVRICEVPNSSLARMVNFLSGFRKETGCVSQPVGLIPRKVEARLRMR